jgi:iron complex outermembrane receptor protein
MRRSRSDRFRPLALVLGAGLLAWAFAGSVRAADADPSSAPRPAGDPEEEDSTGSDEGSTDEGAEWDARIAVKAELREATSAPLGASTTVIDPERAPGTASNLTDLVVGSPGVSQNGQGGHFQVFSVRGVSRHRVMNLVSGMRVNSERRAGASVSFVDPLLMDSVEVLRGPSTTLHGSGALGGVVQVFPRLYDGWSAHAGYESDGDENHQVVGFGARGWSVGLARRDAGDATAPDGSPLNSHFTQYSATVVRGWTRGARRYELLFIPTLAEDVGKANTDFPERTTNYPLERHQMLKLSVDSDRGWGLHGYVHAHDLETEVLEAGARSQVVNDSLDYGIRWEIERDLAPRTSLRWGLQGVGRADVRAEESGQAPSLDGAREIEAGAFAALHWTRPATEYEVGGRLSWQNQANAGFPDEDLSAVNGFVGVMRRFGSRVRLRGSVSSGLRYPNLSERFFTGTTGAGSVAGNPDLDPERSLNAEISLRWLGSAALVDASVFRNEIDDYIERIEIAEDVRTFVNRTSGTLQGLELQIVVLAGERWNVTTGGHLLRGRDDDERALVDVPPHQVYAGLRHHRGAWSFETRLTHRTAKTDPGSGELRREAADELSATADYRFGETWSLALTGSNLLDEEYFPAADDKAPFAPERSVGLRVVRRAAP